MKANHELLTALKVTAEIYGRQMSDAAATMLLADLTAYAPTAVIAALGKCRREIRVFPTLADIIARIDDGRPGVEEAWAMIPKDERDSVVWTDEMARAFGAVRGLLDEGDPIAARMAFKEVYLRRVAESRGAGLPAKWTASLGHEKLGRESALREAIEKSRITAGYALNVLPDPTRAAISGQYAVRALLDGATKPMPKEESET